MDARPRQDPQPSQALRPIQLRERPPAPMHTQEMTPHSQALHAHEGGLGTGWAPQGNISQQGENLEASLPV